MPATTVDKHRHIMAWHLDGLLGKQQMVCSFFFQLNTVIQHAVQDDYNQAIRNIQSALKTSNKCKDKDDAAGQDDTSRKSWCFQGFRPPPNSVFGAGTKDYSPGWFQQGMDVSVEIIGCISQY